MSAAGLFPHDERNRFSVRSSSLAINVGRGWLPLPNATEWTLPVLRSSITAVDLETNILIWRVVHWFRSFGIQIQLDEVEFRRPIRSVGGRFRKPKQFEILEALFKAKIPIVQLRKHCNLDAICSANGPASLTIPSPA
jgi:hypothetical protein